jgi:hypothetical protein
MGVRTKITNTKALKAAAASVLYYAFRTREVQQDRVGIFDRTSNHPDVKRFIRSLDDPLTRERPGQPPRIPKMPRMLFTMSSQGEHGLCGAGGVGEGQVQRGKGARAESPVRWGQNGVALGKY